MRIGVYEWASCGGASHLADLPQSIRQEGQAMCQALIDSLAASAERWQPVCPWRDAAADRATNEIKGYAGCDQVIVVAPESDNILRDTLDQFHQQSLPTCNCDRQFVMASSDKWETACRLRAANVPHPPTWLLSEFNWSDVASSGQLPARFPNWVLKPRDGVGCEGILRMAFSELEHEIQQRRAQADRWLVQPWLPGQACSRAAIVDAMGRCHWLPVTTQSLQVDRQVAYLGGAIMPDFPDSDPLASFLRRTIQAIPGQALGWVGIDFVWNPSDWSHPWTIIEINPRLTTSFVGLASDYPGLAGQVVRAVQGQSIALPSRWSPTEFKVS